MVRTVRSRVRLSQYESHWRKVVSPAMMSENRRNLLIYVCFLNILSCLLFFVGFFSYKPHLNDVSSLDGLPVEINKVSFNVTELYKRQYSRMVFMVIDALRYDFVAHGKRMPYLNKKLRDNATSCLLSATTGVPTVTLPRIKAITSGTVPNFLDVIFNFGSTELMDDNVIQQAVDHNLTIVFYGDDTWLRLFPYAFTRSQGIPSFFVNDFYEVDATVTRNLKKELTRSDWDIMVLHYLGLDHIGHVEGPFGESIPSKLLEMDDVIKLIMESFKDEQILFVITGDHGMRNSGGHGGSSLEEITVPVVLLNTKCDESLGDHPFQQVDLAPLLAVLLGIPIPAGSIGKVSPKWVAGVGLNASLYAAVYNTYRMVKTLRPPENQKLAEELFQGVEDMISYFTSNASAEIAKRAFARLFNSQSKIASMYIGSNEVNMALLIPAVAILTQSMALLFVDETTSMHSTLKACINMVILWVMTALASVYILPKLLGIDLGGRFMMGLPAVAGLFKFNYVLLERSQFTWKIMENCDKVFLGLCGLLPLTYMSTSFVEEEHLYWYFTFVTLITWASLHDINALKELYIILVLQRGLKNLNSTGDKWSNDTDIGDWLKESDNEPLRIGLLGVGSFLSMLMNWEMGRRSFAFVPIDVIFLILQTLLSISYHLTTNGLWLSKSSGVWEVEFFWTVTTCRIAVAVFIIYRSEKETSYSALTVITQLHLSVITLFMDAHNVVLAPCLMLFSKIIRAAAGNPWHLVVLHYWLGEVFFFYMGNSNSLSTVNVTVGFIGLNEFHLGLAVLYVFLYTYAFPILSFLQLTLHLLDMERLKARGCEALHNVMSSMYLLLNGIPLLVFMIVIYFQREHLFVWSVFSPKLLYLMVHTILIVALTVPTVFL